MTNNEHRFCMCLMSDTLPPEDQAKLSERKAAVSKGARWQTTQSITIQFLAGSAALQERVKKVALEWLEVVNLKFVFVNSGPADIRIDFIQGKGSWSYLGTVCRSIDPE